MFSRIKNLLLRLLRKPLAALRFITKIPSYGILGLDIAFSKFFVSFGKIIDFIDNVALRPCHNTKPYRWFKGLGGASRMSAFVALFTIFWIFSGSIGGDGGSRFGSAPETNIARTVQVKTSVARAHLPIVEISGVTEANHKLEIRAQTSGTVRNILKTKGSDLAENEVFLTLDNAIRAAELKQARATYNQLRLENQAAVSLARGGYESRVKATEIQANFARAEAALERARYNLEKSRYSAPFAGTLVDSPLDIGDYVSPGTFVGTVVDLSQVKIIGYVSEKEVDRLQGLGPLEVEIAGKAYQGELVFISSSANLRTRSFAVEVIVANEDEEIRDGVPAILRLPQKIQNAHFISSGWLTLDSNGTVGVRLVDSNNIVAFAPIDVVQTDGSGVWVAGLAEQVTVIIAGQETVTAGEEVEAVLKIDENVPDANAVDVSNNINEDTQTEPTQDVEQEDIIEPATEVVIEPISESAQEQ